MAFCLGALVAISPAEASFEPGWARAAFASFVKHYWSTSDRYLLNQYPSNGQATQYWTAAQGFDTLIDAVRLYPTDQYYRSLLDAFYDTQDKIGWLRSYYDDENWMGMALVRAYEVTHDRRFLDKAVFLWKDITGAWDTSCCGNIPGGNWWDKQHTQKATASNAGPVILSLMLHSHFPTDRSYSAFAEKVYHFWLEHMVNPSTYQVADHLTTSGGKVWWKFTYNEGLMIGASVYMHSATQNATYLSIAQRIASFVLANEVTRVGDAAVLFDGTNSGCQGDCEQFKGPAFRYLTALYHALAKQGAHAPTSGPSAGQIHEFLKANVDTMWAKARNPTLNLFSVDWAGPAPVPNPSAPVYQAQQNAATMAQLLFASNF